MDKLRQYVDLFNQNDEEHFPTTIPNREAYAFLAKHIPLVDLPDKALERTYYFRWWTYRKHIRRVENDKWVITEFLPDVPWAGAYNTINCAAWMHIREGRWLRDSERLLTQYMDHWLNGPGDSHKYSLSLLSAIADYCDLHGEDVGKQRLARMIAFFERRQKTARQYDGLYHSIDNYDGMEYSQSGSGLRPTINSYVCADALAIARFADAETAAQYRSLAQELWARTDALLWQDGFYRTVPENPHPVDRELIGYVPWCFHLPSHEKAEAFKHLLDREAFLAPAGLTTLEQRSTGFMTEHDHECLWNGPVWPFATTQTLVAAANLLRDEEQSYFTADDYYMLLRQYAMAHRRTLADGQQVDWIDENIHPETGAWLSRDILEGWGWPAAKGGYERGKDYNHSMFCDLILSGLLGIGVGQDGKPTVNPLIPKDWPYFRVEGVQLNGQVYDISYDREKGLSILPKEA